MVGSYSPAATGADLDRLAGAPLQETDMEWTGQCLCGKRRYRAVGEPLAQGYCHCSMCRRATGGPFAVLVRFEAVDWLDEEPAVYRSSPIAERGFCPDCGAPLFLRYDHDRRMRMTVGSLDRADLIKPEGHYGIESRLPWTRELGHGLPEEETKERF